LGDEAGGGEHPQGEQQFTAQVEDLKASKAAVSRGTLSMVVFLESGAPDHAELDWSDENCQAIPGCTATRVASKRDETWSFAKMWLKWRSTVFSLRTTAAAIARWLWASGREAELGDARNHRVSRGLMRAVVELGSGNLQVAAPPAHFGAGDAQ
jgi:hypothetical protein